MYKTIKTMRQALAEARAYRDPVNEDRGFSTQQIKMAYGILNDPRYKQGNYSGAVSAIEKIAKGLSDHPDVANALRRANEELDKDDEKSVDGVVKQLKKAVKAHQGQVKSLTKDLKDEKDLEEGTITEFKKMTVTFKSMADMSKASTDLAKQGFTIDAKGMVMKVDGKGADLNKYATDIKNFYGATVKAESLEEANMKRILGALQDKLSKEGGAAGFDDLKKTAKSMGLDLTPAMLKDMPGIKQHRDGDYILEEIELEENVNAIVSKVKGMVDFVEYDKRDRAIIVPDKDVKKVADFVKRQSGSKEIYVVIGHKENVVRTTAGKAFARKIKDRFYDDKIHGKQDQVIINPSLGMREELDKDDEKSVDGVVKQLKKAVKAHQGQVDTLTKDLKDEKDLEEAVFDSDSMQTIKLKNGAKVLDKIYTNRTQADNAASSLMKQHKGAEADAYQSPFNNKFYVRIKEDLEERVSKQDADKFDMAKYKENERDNQHSDNALLLVKKFGTAADYKKVVDIDIRHQKAGSISMADLKTRNDISRKYIGRLM